MRLHELRKNPQLNPKTSINQRIINRLNNTNEMIAGIKNLFVSFTSVEKLGVNPESSYNTPLGIYSYPADYVVQSGQNINKMMKHSVPFAGEQPWVNLFEVSNTQGEILNLTTIDDDTVQDLVEEVASYVYHINKSRGDEDPLFAYNQIKGFYKTAKNNAKVPGLPGGQFWYVVWRAADVLKTISSRKSETKKNISALFWNKMFRDMGIAGCVDLGSGIIHEKEPTQAVFFDPRIIKNVERLSNKYSPDFVKQGEQHGAERKEKIKIINSLNTGQEIVSYLIDANDNDLLNYVKDPEKRLAVIGISSLYIRYLKKPTPQEQYLALSKNIRMVDYIKNLDYNILENLIDNSPEGLKRAEILTRNLNRTNEEKLAPMILRRNPLLIFAFGTIFNKQLINYAWQLYKQANPNISLYPKWKNLFLRYGVPLPEN